MTEKKTYTGGCHCGKVRFEAKADLSKVMACNCSMCSKMGSRLVFVANDDFKLLSGKEALSDYQFHKKQIHHVFCSNCGIRSFAHGVSPKGGEMYAVNVRCLDDVGVDADGMPTQHFDGRSL